MFDLARWEPFDGLNLIDNFFEDTWRRPQAVPGAVWYPPVDILESKDSYLIRAELPGMKQEDFNLELNDGTLTLTGERKVEEPAEGVEYHHSERLAGKFSRSFHLPQTVAQDGIKATYRDGILEVYVPKAEEAKPRKITVNVN
jgi:HSP20 family protein